MPRYTNRIKEALPHLSKRDIDNVIARYHREVREDILAGERVYLTGLGVLFSKVVSGRVSNLPHIKDLPATPTVSMRFQATRPLTQELKAQL